MDWLIDIYWRIKYRLEEWGGCDQSNNEVANGRTWNALLGNFGTASWKMAYLATNRSWEAMKIPVDSWRQGLSFGGNEKVRFSNFDWFILAQSQKTLPNCAKMAYARLNDNLLKKIGPLYRINLKEDYTIKKYTNSLLCREIYYIIFYSF